jgi:phage terminase large subunit-like protein
MAKMIAVAFLSPANASAIVFLSNASHLWGVNGDVYYLLDVVRDRLSYPALKRKAMELYEQWSAFHKPTVLIEDAGSGSSLIQDLESCGIPCGVMPW